MTIVNSDFLAGLMTNYRAIFKAALDEAFANKPIFQEISTKFTSTTSDESYGWMGANPNMSEWTDKRQIKDLKAYSYTLTNKHFEGTIAVNRDTYEDDKFGLIAPRIQGLARRAVRHMNQAVIDHLDAGESLLAFDGAAFFKTNRTIGLSGTIDNLKSGNYSNSAAEILAALDLAYSTMQNYKDDKGVPMGILPDTIVCSPAMYIPIRTALMPSVAGTVLPEAGIFQDARILASPFIDADALDWYILCTKEVEVRPLIFQSRKDVEFVSMDKPDDSNVFMQNKFYYGVDDRFAPGYGDPRTAIKIIDT